jgi:hypothetical protein
MMNIEHPTTNIEHPMKLCGAVTLNVGRSMLVVGCFPSFRRAGETPALL